jgi:hypothetical protein
MAVLFLLFPSASGAWARVLAETGIETKQGFMRLEPGMTEIESSQPSVISYLLSRLLSYKQEGLRER